MAESFEFIIDKNEEIQETQEIIELKTVTSVGKMKQSMVRPEVATANLNTEKNFFKIICVGDYCGGWSKRVFIEDYKCPDGKLSENRSNSPVIGVDFHLKTLYLKSGKQIRLQIWDMMEIRRTFNAIYYKYSQGAIVFWGPRSNSMESAIEWRQDISRNLERDIPVILVVDNTGRTPAKWIGQGLVMNSTEEMDSFCLEHGFIAWFEMLERGGGEKSAFGQAMSKLVDEIIFRNKHQEQRNTSV